MYTDTAQELELCYCNVPVRDHIRDVAEIRERKIRCHLTQDEIRVFKEDDARRHSQW